METQRSFANHKSESKSGSEVTESNNYEKNDSFH